VAFQLSGSLMASRMALLASVLCPIHLAYSQTARGYTMIMFFSAATIYICLKLLTEEKYFKWGAILVLCGFLSVYTIPTNSLFILGICLWTGMVLMVPVLRQEFGLNQAEAIRKAKVFALIFFSIGFLSLLAYWPVLDQIKQASIANRHQFNNLYGEHPLVLKVIITMKNVLFLVFQGPWKWFLPLLVLGIIFGLSRRMTYRFLPVLVFLVPFGVSLITDIVGYPRVYLFNLPLLMVFFGSGIAWLAKAISSIHIKFLPDRILVFLLGIIIFLPQGHYLFSQYFPSLKTYDGESFRKTIQDKTGSHDLIFVSDVAHYIYSRPVFEANLKKILTENDLLGFKIISSDRSHMQNFLLHDGGGGFPFFKILKDIKDIPSIDLQGVAKMFSIPSSKGKSLLPADFEAEADWELIHGKGEWKVQPENKFEGGKIPLVATGKR